MELYGKVVSDTTNPVSIQPGKSYQFRMTVVAGSNPPCCYLESNEYFEVVYTGNSGRDYFYKVTAKEGLRRALPPSSIPCFPVSPV